MLITEETKYYDFATFESCVEEECVKEIESAAERKYGSYWEQTLGQVFSAMQGDFSYIGVDAQNIEDATVYQYYWMKGWKDWFEQLTKTMKALTPPQSADSKKASNGTHKMSFQETVLIDTRSYFGLHSFKEAEQIGIGEYILARKDSYNKAVVNNNFAKIRSEKARKK